MKRSRRIAAAAVAARIAATVIVALLPLSHAAADDSPVSIDLRLRERLALELEDASVQVFEIEALPKLRASLPAGFELTGIVRSRLEVLDTLEPGRPRYDTYFPASEPWLLGDVVATELRELYLTRYFHGAFLSLGKQQIVWGKADGIKLLDVVDPQSFREFILPPFDESRIPLWTVDLEVPVKSWTAQLLWIPDPTVHDLPEDGAPYEIRSSTLIPTAPPGVEVDIEHARRPQHMINDSDAGVRLSGAVFGWDVALHYLYHYDDVPIPKREVRFGPDGLVAVVTPGYERTHVGGLALANSFGVFTVRSEAAVFTPRYVATNDMFDADGIVRSDEWSWLVGLDWFANAETFVSGQLMQSYVTDLPAAAIREDLQSITTLLVRRQFADAAGVADAMLLMDPDRGDGLVRGRIKYDLRSWLAVGAGVDVFFGSSAGIFGEYDHRSRVVVEFEQHL